VVQWSRVPKWWEYVDRRAAVVAAGELAESGGVLVFAGPPAFGHMQALSLAVIQLRRFGWVCHDLTATGPLDAPRLVVNGLDSIFPAAPNGLPQTGMVSRLSTMSLAGYVRDACVSLGTKHCLIAAYADDSRDIGPGDIAFLRQIASENQVSVLLTSTNLVGWQAVQDIDAVYLSSFQVTHVTNCLRSASVKFNFAMPGDAAIDDELAPLRLDDGSVVPQAAYEWLRKHHP
jgi:hypothetical protein